MRGYVDQGITEKVRAAGGEIYAVSSEPQVLADRAKVAWKLDFESVGDPHHEIAGTCRERDHLDLFVNERLGFLEASADAAADWKPTHPKGYFQPGVLALRADGRVLYRWRGVPTHKNMGGAVERPTAEYVWGKIAVALEQPDSGADAPLDIEPPLDVVGIPWPLFASLLVANGRFTRVQGFKSAQQVQAAKLRLAVFVALWIAAFALLPKLLVLTALAAWVVFIAPKLHTDLHRAHPPSGSASLLSNTIWLPSAVTRTTSPSANSPLSSASASGSCTSRWITRFSGRAP